MQHRILRRKWFLRGLKSSALSPPTYIYISCILNWITVKWFIIEAQPGGHALGNLFTDKCIIHQLDLIIRNLQDNHTPRGNSFHKPKWLYLKEWCGRKERRAYELKGGEAIASLHLGSPGRKRCWALPHTFAPGRHYCLLFQEPPFDSFEGRREWWVK